MHITSAMELDNFDVDIFGTFFIMMNKQLDCKNHKKSKSDNNPIHPTRKIMYVNVEYLSDFYYYHNNKKYHYEFNYMRGYELKSCAILEMASPQTKATAKLQQNKIADRTIELLFDRSKQTINVGTVDELNQILQKQKNKFHKKPCPNIDKIKFYHRACKMSKLCDIIEAITNSKVEVKLELD